MSGGNSVAAFTIKTAAAVVAVHALCAARRRSDAADGVLYFPRPRILPGVSLANKPTQTDLTDLRLVPMETVCVRNNVFRAGNCGQPGKPVTATAGRRSVTLAAVRTSRYVQLLVGRRPQTGVTSFLTSQLTAHRPPNCQSVLSADAGWLVVRRRTCTDH